MKRKDSGLVLQTIKEANHNIDILNFPVYKNEKTTYKCKCKKCGNEFESKARELIRGRGGCKKCLKNYKPTQEEFVEKIKNINPNIEIIGEYINAHTSIECKCLKCGYIWNPKADSLVQGNGCPSCYHRKTFAGFNDVATTNPELVKYFKNPNDATLCTRNSLKEYWFKCPQCGYEKYSPISYIYNRGMCCPMCSDGISYPEKVMRNVLLQLGVNYTYQKTFRWSKRKRYDFYFVKNKQKIIIEVHGNQHYSNSFNRLGGNTLEHEQNNDNLKKKLALENNIDKYIVIDARKSNIDFIKSSVLHSELSDLFDLSLINWKDCNEAINVTMQIKVLELWNQNKMIYEIKDMLGIADTTIGTYLTNLAKLGLCDYDPQINWDKTKFKKEVLPHNIHFIQCRENRRVFNGLMDCKQYLQNTINIGHHAIDHRKIKESCETGISYLGLHFDYIEIIRKE